ncbi:MAG TPA: hypothetical protein VM686_38750, partial [Polyangiaceae bacterium]|nr:hypothetical protein [Polyangiaceae bacterium]
MRRASSLILSCGLLLGASRAHAEEVTYSLFYLPAKGCPSAEQFAAELATRAPWLTEADGEAPLSIEVSFQESTPVTGVLVVRDTDGQTTTRSVPGSSCAEVVSALALITTVLVDAQRAEKPAPAPAPR